MRLLRVSVFRFSINRLAVTVIVGVLGLLTTINRLAITVIVGVLGLLTIVKRSVMLLLLLVLLGLVISVVL